MKIRYLYVKFIEINHSRDVRNKYSHKQINQYSHKNYSTVVVITEVCLPSAESKCKLCTGSILTRSVAEVCDNEILLNGFVWNYGLTHRNSHRKCSINKVFLKLVSSVFYILPKESISKIMKNTFYFI